MRSFPFNPFCKSKSQTEEAAEAVVSESADKEVPVASESEEAEATDSAVGDLPATFDPDANGDLPATFGNSPEQFDDFTSPGAQAWQSQEYRTRILAGVQGGAWSPGQGASAASASTSSARGGKTTVMLKNLPNDYLRDEMLELINSQGFRGLYNFFYLPVDWKRRAGLGYAFINFVDTPSAVRFMEKFNDFGDWKKNSVKKCQTTWGDKQGLETAIETYRNSPMMHPDVDDKYKAVLFENGVRIQFPPATKKVRAPRASVAKSKDGQPATSAGDADSSVASSSPSAPAKKGLNFKDAASLVADDDDDDDDEEEDDYGEEDTDTQDTKSQLKNGSSSNSFGSRPATAPNSFAQMSFNSDAMFDAREQEYRNELTRKIPGAGIGPGPMPMPAPMPAGCGSSAAAGPWANHAHAVGGCGYLPGPAPVMQERLAHLPQHPMYAPVMAASHPVAFAHQAPFIEEDDEAELLNSEDMCTAGSSASPATLPESEFTTVMVRNIPNDYLRDNLLSVLDDEGFRGKYNFVYLPVDFKRKAGLGYAFVNMINHFEAEQFMNKFSGYNKWKVGSQKVCTTEWGMPSQQGIDSNIQRYRNSPLMHPDVPEQFKAALFDGETRIEFPKPTKKLKAPRKHFEAPTVNKVSER